MDRRAAGAALCDLIRNVTRTGDRSRRMRRGAQRRADLPDRLGIRQNISAAEATRLATMRSMRAFCVATPDPAAAIAEAIADARLAACPRRNAAAPPLRGTGGTRVESPGRGGIDVDGAFDCSHWPRRMAPLFLPGPARTAAPGRWHEHRTGPSCSIAPAWCASLGRGRFAAPADCTDQCARAYGAHFAPAPSSRRWCNWRTRAGC